MFTQIACSTCRSLAIRKTISYSLLSPITRSTTLNGIIRGTRNLPAKEPKSTSYAKNIWTKLFGKYLFATNVISSGILMVIGDVAAQEVEYRRGILKKRYDLARMWRMFIVGSLQGPLHHYAYGWMDRVMPKVTTKNTIKKILLDQFIMSPVCILLFFYPACFLEGKGLTETNTEVVSKFPYIYITDWCVWPAAQFVNFQYLEPRYRVIFVNVMTALYNVFISYIKHDEGGNFLEKFSI